MTTPTDARPLAGVTVVDMTRVLAGPFCTLILSNLGARVIKVERPPHGDDARTIGPVRRRKEPVFLGAQLREGVDRARPPRDADRAIFDELLGSADVLVETFRPGVLERLGYGWAVLHARWPALVYAAVSGFGHTGPLRERPAFDLVAQAWAAS
jgi:CoA:oxalate CoA-transferase